MPTKQPGPKPTNPDLTTREGCERIIREYREAMDKAEGIVEKIADLQSQIRKLEAEHKAASAAYKAMEADVGTARTMMNVLFS